MNKNFLLALLLFASTILSAQEQSSTASIFFETDKSELSPEAQKTLDALAPTLLQSPDYQVNIELLPTTVARNSTTFALLLTAPHP
ncbi:MAG: hypothetical protein IPH31_12085 [Lewinellaceae bacterium]|nr:hypothetical protein [Lewinellaceae bacterium]